MGAGSIVYDKTAQKRHEFMATVVCAQNSVAHLRLDAARSAALSRGKADYYGETQSFCLSEPEGRVEGGEGIQK